MSDASNTATGTRKRGRPPRDGVAMTDAERARRYRAAKRKQRDSAQSSDECSLRERREPEATEAKPVLLAKPAAPPTTLELARR